RVDRRLDRHVVRALQHHRPVARPRLLSVHVGQLSAVGRGYHHRRRELRLVLPPLPRIHPSHAVRVDLRGERDARLPSPLTRPGSTLGQGEKPTLVAASSRRRSRRAFTVTGSTASAAPTMQPASAYESPSTSAALTQSPTLNRARVQCRTAPVITQASE